MAPFEGAPGSNEVTRADIEAANQLVAENKLLKDSPRVKALMENDYVTEDGRQLDPGEFISKMLKFIESQDGVDQTVLGSMVEQTMAVHSTPPEAERKLDDTLGGMREDRA